MSCVIEVWSAGGEGGAAACGNSSMDLKHEVAYRGIPSQSLVKAEPGVSHNGHNGHVRDWMAGGGSPSPAAGQPQPNGYSSPLSSGSYGPYSPNGKIGKIYIYYYIIHHLRTFSTRRIDFIVVQIAKLSFVLIEVFFTNKTYLNNDLIISYIRMSKSII